MKNWKHFTLKEMIHSDTAERNNLKNLPDGAALNNLDALVRKVLDPLREYYGEPIKVTSGYRPAKQTLLLLNNKELELWLKEVLSHKNYMHIIQNTYIIVKNDTAYMTVYRVVFKYANDKQNKQDIINIINNKQIRCTLKEFGEEQMFDSVIKILTELGMKFDYVIMNPPYSGSLHLDFFEIGLEFLKKNGKIMIVEPAMWLIQTKNNGLYVRPNSKAVKLKNKIKNHIELLVIENYNKEFNTRRHDPFSVVWINFSKNTKCTPIICGQYFDLQIDDVSLNGSLKKIKNILQKIKHIDTVSNHIYDPNKSIKENNNYYSRYNDLIGQGGCEGINFNDTYFAKTKSGEFCVSYINSLYSIKYNDIFENVPFSIKNGSNKGTLTDKEAKCITGTKQELENWKYFVFNNSLPLFINIVMTIDQHNNSLEYVPWLVDKKYTDEEIYKMFNFTKEEIELIENTIKKYERNSAWFMRYMTGDTSIQIDQNEPWKEVK